MVTFSPRPLRLLLSNSRYTPCAAQLFSSVSYSLSHPPVIPSDYQIRGTRQSGPPSKLGSVRAWSGDKGSTGVWDRKPRLSVQSSCGALDICFPRCAIGGARAGQIHEAANLSRAGDLHRTCREMLNCGVEDMMANGPLERAGSLRGILPDHINAFRRALV